jgi:hypothetical protein
MEGRDLLSDHGQGSALAYPVFKSVGSWALGPDGQFHLEIARMTFGQLWVGRTFSSGGWVSVRDALAYFREHVSVVTKILSAD